VNSSNFEFLRNRRPDFFRELAFAERELYAKADITRVRIRRVAESLALGMLHDVKIQPGQELFAHIQEISGAPSLGSKFSRPLDKIRYKCNSSAHEILGEAHPRYIKDTIVLLEILHDVIKQWLKRSEPDLVVPAYEEPPRIASPETDEELDEILREYRELHEAQERKAMADQEFASIWEGDGKILHGFQKLTHGQVGKFIKNHASVEFQSAFEGAFTPELYSSGGLSGVQAELGRLLDEQQQADADIAKRVAALERREEQIFTREEWSNDYPAENWSEAPSFFEERLRKGLPPFEAWLMPPMKIGEGAHGVVYRCYPSGGGVPVAVKIPRVSRDMKSVKRAWEWEVQSAQKLAVESAHRTIEGVPRPLAISPEGHLGYVVYELIDGRTLREELRNKSIHPKRAMYLVDRLMGILRRLLDADIRFTDLADRNVMIRRDGEPTLVDLAPCIASEAHPPEWNDETRFTGTAREVRSGHYYMLGKLFLKMIGVVEQQAFGLRGSLGSIDIFLESSGGPSEDVRKRAQRSAILDRCRGIPGLDAEAFADVIEDCTFNAEVRRQMKPAAFIKVIQDLYDPSGIVRTIFSDS
jgi:hypothetical protein